jgi:hypothetical protein
LSCVEETGAGISSRMMGADAGAGSEVTRAAGFCLSCSLLKSDATSDTTMDTTLPMIATSSHRIWWALSVGVRNVFEVSKASKDRKDRKDRDETHNSHFR